MVASLLAETDLSITSVITAYGPMGFGLVVLLVVWKAIVKPLLDERKSDIEQLRNIATVNQATAVALSETARSLATVAATLRGTADRMDSSLARLEKA